MTGKLIRVISVRGFGFVMDDAGDERFVQANDLLDPVDWPNLRAGQTLEFEPRDRDNGKRNGLGVTKARRIQ